MVQQKRGGVIVTMSSVNGTTAIPTIAGYNASKGGIDNLTRCPPPLLFSTCLLRQHTVEHPKPLCGKRWSTPYVILTPL